MKILYHYCSNSAFYSIVSNKSIWLSSLSLSNDTMEGRLVSEILLKLAEEDSLKEYDSNRLRDMVDDLREFFDGLGFCLSENGDLLSQWRGYANDASGVSIGFSDEYLELLSRETKSQGGAGFTLQKVEYENATQVELIRPAYAEIKELIDKGAFRFPAIGGILGRRTDEEIEKETRETKKIFSQLSMAVLMLFSKLYLLKAKAFREEREWRLISYLVKEAEDHCSFRASHDRIIPYREFKIPPLSKDAITEVYLGPKNITPNHIIKSFLNQNGFENTKVLRSEATYR
jgi:hypothetical protein